MAEIKIENRGVFGEAHNLAGVDFTPEEPRRIADLADELKHILEGAKRRVTNTHSGRHSRSRAMIRI